jgi:hypothetical protein
MLRKIRPVNNELFAVFEGFVLLLPIIKLIGKSPSCFLSFA